MVSYSSRTSIVPLSKNISDLSEQIERISSDEKLRKLIGKKGKLKYTRYFNSTLVAEFILNKTFDFHTKN